MWWKLAGGGAVLALLALLVWMYGNARESLGQQKEQTAELGRAVTNEKMIAGVQLAAEQRVTGAVSDYAARAAALQPIIVTSHETVERYAETAAGRVSCRDPERVRDVQALDQALFSAPASAQAASSGAGAVPTNPAAQPVGR